MHCSQNNHPEIIRQIAELGYEIGYHYEDLTLCKGNHDEAYENFKKNLEYFRQYYEVKTICMHGSPMSKWDSRDLWKHFNYHQLGIIGEPYLDIDFLKVLYLTDTGRRWDGQKVSVRDKVGSQQFRTTFYIIKAAENNALPDKIMITVHPQRWTNNAYLCCGLKNWWCRI